MLLRVRGLLVSLVLVAGCYNMPDTPDDGDLPPDTDFPLAMARLTPTVAAGSAVQVRLENNGAIALGFNLCTGGFLERKTSTGWVELPHLALPCALIINTIDPGQASTIAFSVPGDAPHGIYRLRVHFTGINDGHQIVRRSDEFIVD